MAEEEELVDYDEEEVSTARNIETRISPAPLTSTPFPPGSRREGLGGERQQKGALCWNPCFRLQGLSSQARAPPGYC